MYEDNTRSASGHAPRTSAGVDTANRAAHDTANRPGSVNRVGLDTANRASPDTANRAGLDTNRPGQDAAKGSTDPKFARESFTMRRMQTWQIMALAVFAAIVIGLVVFYI